MSKRFTLIVAESLPDYLTPRESLDEIGRVFGYPPDEVCLRIDGGKLLAFVNPLCHQAMDYISNIEDNYPILYDDVTGEPILDLS